MTLDERLESRLTAGLTDLAGTSTPDLRDDILAVTAGTPQRRTWPLQRSVFPAARAARARRVADREVPHDSHPSHRGRGRARRSPSGSSSTPSRPSTVGVPRTPHRRRARPRAPPRSRTARCAAGTYVVTAVRELRQRRLRWPSQPGCSDAIPDDDIRVTFTRPRRLGRDGRPTASAGHRVRQTPDGAAIIFVRGASPYDDPCDDGSGHDPGRPDRRRLRRRARGASAARRDDPRRRHARRVPRQVPRAAGPRCRPSRAAANPPASRGAPSTAHGSLVLRPVAG